ncbi:hypothetical protein K438DRAFT_938608 [Mycena galopus ATCC 62051]|nr:hypothetical protein K438DRAFT_938608 [Mycena galopus ATCC 62051]
MTTLGPRFSSPSASYMPTASPMYLPASRNRASNVTVANDLNTRTSKAEPKPTVVPGGLTTLQTRATSSEVCRNFLIDRCIWGSSCHRVHVLPPLESHPPVESRATLSKTPSDSDSRPSKVVATEYVVKIPNPRFQAQMPLVRLNSQRSCFDATDPNARTPVVRLRSRSSECPPENLSQDSFPDPNLDPDMRRYCDLNSSMWASKTGEISWASDGENPSQNAPYDDLNSWGYRAQDSSWSAQIPSRIDVPGKDRDTDNDLNSWGSRADESSWTTDGVENPSQLTPRPHDADLNSWGSKTEESSWTADGAENLTPTRLTPRSHLHGADLNSWGLKTKENSWGNAGSSSSLTENSSSIATLSSQPPPTRNPEINRLPLLDSQICRDWARGNCTYGQRCRFVHGGLNNRGPPVRLLTTHGSYDAKTTLGSPIVCCSEPKFLLGTTDTR